MGAEAARRAAEAIIAIADPKVVCSAGFAGALEGGLKVGDVVRPRTVINAGDASRAIVEGGEGGAVTAVTFEDEGEGTRVVMCDIHGSKEALDEAVASGGACGWTEMFAQLDELLAAPRPAL